MNDIRLNSDSGKISVLVLLDLSAAFDNVNHNILRQRLEKLGWVFWDGTQMVQVILRNLFMPLLPAGWIIVMVS